MKVTKIITTASPSIGPCTRCNSDMASIYEIPGEKLKVLCLSCGIPVGDFPTIQVYHKCPSCYEDRLNLGTGKCEVCDKSQPIDFDREAKVSYNDRDKVYKFNAATITPPVIEPEPTPQPEPETEPTPEPDPEPTIPEDGAEPDPEQVPDDEPIIPEA